MDTTASSICANVPSADLEFWLSHRRYQHTQFTLSQLAEAVHRTRTRITVMIPAKEVASTVGGVLSETVAPLVQARIVSDVVVIDAASVDGTANIAIANGACVIQRAQIAAELGPSRGKGDALWRGLLATSSDIVAFLDGDTSDPSPAHLIGILGPLLLYEEIQMVKACFDRPFKRANGGITPHDGGRVTEILGRPLLNLHWPDLAGFRQPLAGEFAARRELLEKLSFPIDYGVDIGTLIDAYKVVGLNGLAEADVGQRQNAHKPLRELTTMGTAVLCAQERRLGHGTSIGGRTYLPWENAFCDVDTIERPPIKEYMQQLQSSAIPTTDGWPTKSG